MLQNFQQINYKNIISFNKIKYEIFINLEVLKIEVVPVLPIYFCGLDFNKKKIKKIKSDTFYTYAATIVANGV